jgi:hypothetical protein
MSQNMNLKSLSCRNIDKLPISVSKETINRLKGFIGLKNEQEIGDWHDFCRNSPDKAVQSKLAALLMIIHYC